jgi:hypothetical protein
MGAGMIKPQATKPITAANRTPIKTSHQRFFNIDI